MQPLQPKLTASKFMNGFTLIEIIVVLAIMAVAATIAAPNLASMIRVNRISSEVNTLSASIRTAKSEAIKQGKNFTICTSVNGKNCNQSLNWNSGWIIFPDDEKKKEPDTESDIILIQKSFNNLDSISSLSHTISINYEGFFYDLPNNGLVIFTFTTIPNDDAAQRCITINQAGLPKILKKGEDNCA